MNTLQDKAYYMPRHGKRRVSATEIVTVLLVRLALAFLNGYFAMLLLGIAHSTDPRVPALGYTTTFILVLAFSTIVTAATSEALDRRQR